MRKVTFYIIYFILLIGVVWLVPGNANPEVMINVIPLHTIKLYVTAMLHGYAPIYIILGNLLGNILLFIPLGVLLIFHLRHVGVILLVFLSVYIPIYIELVQFILHLVGYGTRSIDIDDVLLNMFGIWLGYFGGFLIIYKKTAK